MHFQRLMGIDNAGVACDGLPNYCRVVPHHDIQDRQPLFEVVGAGWIDKILEVDKLEGDPGCIEVGLPEYRPPANGIDVFGRAETAADRGCPAARMVDLGQRQIQLRCKRMVKPNGEIATHCVERTYIECYQRVGRHREYFCNQSLDLPMERRPLSVVRKLAKEARRQL